MKTHKIIRVEDGDEFEVRSRKRFDFDKMATELLKGNSFTIPDINRKSASYARGRLEDILDAFIDVTYGVHTRLDGTKEEGFLFEYNISKEDYQKVVEENEG